MKKIMLAAMAALAITGCSQSEEMDAPGRNAEIKIGGIVKTSTRADLVTNTNIEEFIVSGFKTTVDMTASTQLTGGFMDNVKVTKSGDNWESATFYWPLSDKVQFFGTSPAQILNIGSTGYPKFEYVVGAIADQKDLIAANLIDKDKDAGLLQLPFNHLLTQVNFSIKGDTEGFSYTVTGLEILGAKDKNTFAFDGTDEAGSWSTASVSDSPAAYLFSGSKVVETTGGLDVTTKLEEADKALFMLMPQTLTDVVTVKITYSAAPTATPAEYTFNSFKNISLTGVWEKGKNVRYTLTLSSDASPIKFGAPSVGDWGAGTPGTTNL